MRRIGVDSGADFEGLRFGRGETRERNSWKDSVFNLFPNPSLRAAEEAVLEKGDDAAGAAAAAAGALAATAFFSEGASTEMRDERAISLKDFSLRIRS